MCKINQEGVGVEYSNDGRIVKGQFKQGKACGLGEIEWRATGDRYVGEFCDNKLSGLGILNHFNGDVSYGYWKDNEKSGFGWMKSVGGFKFEGRYLEGKRKGFGVLTKNDVEYVGRFSNNEKEGEMIVTKEGKFRLVKFIGGKKSQYLCNPLPQT